MDGVQREVEHLVSRLRAAGTPERAAQERRYLKSDLEFYGVRLPDLARLSKEWARPINPGREELLDVVTELWLPPVFEHRAAAMKLLSIYVSRLDPADVELVEHLLRSSKTWALVDELAVHVAGPLLERHADATVVLDRWAVDDDFWIRRAALLSHLTALRSGKGNWERFTRYAESMLDEKEFFIRKAIGWILRDTSRKRPDLVYEWILPRAPRCSGVTVREAVKRLSAEQARSVMVAYRSGDRSQGATPSTEDGTSR
jgi:3-methyladenine DNA glycosylase AlkD